MVQFIADPTIVEAGGTPPKTIEEYFGRVNTQSDDLSIARMLSPSGWSEPGQVPEFDEYTIVLKGTLHVETKQETFEVTAGQAVSTKAGEWVRYSTPGPVGAEYIAICRPAFAPETVHRDE